MFSQSCFIITFTIFVEINTFNGYKTEFYRDHSPRILRRKSSNQNENPGNRSRTRGVKNLFKDGKPNNTRHRKTDKTFFAPLRILKKKKLTIIS